MKTFPEVMTTDDVMDYLKISRKTLMKLIKEGSIPGRKVGKNYRYLKSEIEKYLKGDSKENYFKQWKFQNCFPLFIMMITHLLKKEENC